MNKLFLIGNLGRDPEMHSTTDGSSMVRFSLAVNRVVRSANGERYQETDWFNIIAWDHLAQTVSAYLHKGDKVFVEGQLTLRQYRDRNNVERTAMEVVIYDLEMLSAKSSSSGQKDDEDEGEQEDEPETLEESSSSFSDK